MNPDSIQTLLERLEDEHTERKLAASDFDRDKLYKYVSALANEGGGHLILGG